MACCHLNKKNVTIVGVFSLFFIIMGLVLVITKENILTKVMESNLVLVNTSQAYPSWKVLPVPLYTSLYFFNVTNAARVQSNGEKPILVEMGPYVFQEFHNKTKLRWNDHNNTVTYQQIRTWKFDPERTNGSLDDVIVTLNAPAATVNAMAAKASGAVKILIAGGLGIINEKLFVAKTVRELAFEGYKDPILTDTAFLPSSLVPQKMDKFGYFYPRNGSDWYDGVFNMYTGKGNLSQLGQIYQWNYTHQLSYFPGKCGEVRGAGDLFPPRQTKTFVELFSNDLCRTLKLDFTTEDKIDGLRVNTYKLSDMFFANKTKNPDNACYNPGNEIPSGLFNASSCRFGAPIFMSQPHFYQADPILLNDIQSGLKPDQSLHETRFNVDPISGVEVEVMARFQVNFRIQPIKEIPLYKNIPQMYFPTVWFQTHVELTPALTSQLWFLSNMTNFCAIFGYVFIGAAFATSAVVFAFFCTKNAGTRERNRSSSDQPILHQSLFNDAQEDNVEEQHQEN